MTKEIGPPRCNNAVLPLRSGWIFHDCSARARSWAPRAYCSLISSSRSGP
ncbi:hypothetical protein OOK13_41615 [Streptomyces sp. NBC_00378]|nr:MULTISPECIES: hypothetical protein [unclassified Streptomyces]MCX5114836.1 hypothetical protein [Streptomyces sp. NBC_00378]